jgi:polyhydroxyalkanoate synthesis regulator phasin
MPKKQPGMTPEEQSQKFRDTVRELVAAGELDPTEADAAMERVMKGVKTNGAPGELHK